MNEMEYKKIIAKALKIAYMKTKSKEYIKIFDNIAKII